MLTVTSTCCAGYAIKRRRSCTLPISIVTADEAIGSALPIRREVPLVVTEGNYLLSDRGGWADVAPLLDESWYLELDDAIRLERLAYRHQLHGMSHEHAEVWARTTDQDNAVLIARSRPRADFVIRMAGS